MTEYIQVLTTTDKKEDADKIAKVVVEKRLAACAQVIGPITSTYWWNEKIERAEEWLCFLKSRNDLYEELERTIAGVHPYEVPEILAVPIVAGIQSYLEWLDKELRSG
ncbi:MAG: divalent-cation tolerance protein CutA [Desulfatiglandales bacterium]